MNVFSHNADFKFTGNRAFVHGRFQPFHCQHLEYVLSSKELCDFLYIGITRSQPQIDNSCIVSPHRSDPCANSLTYFERMEMITLCLLEQGLSQDEFTCLPLPVDNPEYLSYFVSTNVKCYTTICDEWNLHKISVLSDAGYQVESLIDRRIDNSNARISGSTIRRMILENSDSWKTMVPRSVAEYLESIAYPVRLREGFR